MAKTVMTALMLELVSKCYQCVTAVCKRDAHSVQAVDHLSAVTVMILSLCLQTGGDCLHCYNVSNAS